MTDNKTLVITGASTGIGAETARAAAAAGYRLVLAARSRELLDGLVAEIGGDRALAVACDVQEPAAVEGLMTAAVERFGGIDALFANAGRRLGPGGYSAGDVAEWRDALLTNVYGVMLSVRYAIPHLKPRQGDIVLTGSISGRRIMPASVYGATKWAVTGIGYNLREELAGTGMRVMLVEPGMVDTRFFDTPRPEALRPADVARSVVWGLTQPKSVDIHELLILPTPPVA